VSSGRGEASECGRHVLQGGEDNMSLKESERSKEEGKFHHGTGEAIVVSVVATTVSQHEFHSIHEKFMPAFENTMNVILSGASNLPLEKRHLVDDPVFVNKAISKILLRDHSSILPNINNKDVRKLLCGCLVALEEQTIFSKPRRTTKSDSQRICGS